MIACAPLRASIRLRKEARRDTAHGPYDANGTPAQQYRSPLHCVARSNDDLLYVCDRQSDRVQIFKPDGTFIQEVFFAKNTLASRSDLGDRLLPRAGAALHLPDRRPERARSHRQARHHDRAASFRRGGRQPGAQHRGQFQATSTRPRTYEGKRIQKFVFKGIGHA